VTPEARRVALAVAAAAAAFVGWRWWSRLPERMTLAEAKRRAAVVAEVAPSGGGSGAEVRVDVVLRDASATEIVIPAGTLWRSRSAGTQTLAVARTLRFAFRGGEDVQRASAVMQVYCTQRFLAPPDASSRFDLLLDDDPGGGGETNPVRRLASCLDDKHAGAPREQRQMAVWMVSDGLLALTPAEVSHKLAERLRPAAEERARATLRLHARDTLRARAPGVTDDEIDAAVREFEQKRLPRVIDETIDAEVAKDWAATRPLLADCGVDVAGAAFFRGPAAPPAGTGALDTTLDLLVLREGPTVQSREVRKLPKGTRVRVRREAERGWLEVDALGDRGFVHMSRLGRCDPARGDTDCRWLGERCVDRRCQ